MGTPGFAVRPLQVLLEAGENVVGVITAPDRPAGRGKQLRPSEVKDYVLGLAEPLPLLQPEKLKDPAFLEELRALDPDLQVVVAFRMLPESVWSIPPMGTFNLHASLLPQYRGAAPINHVLINGEKETGVTTFFIDEEIDTGKVLLQEATPIAEHETAGELHDRLMDLGAQLVLETVRQLSAGTLEARSQQQFLDSATVLKPAPKIFKEDCRIDWTRTGEGIVNLIHGLSPYPGAFTRLTSEAAKKAAGAGDKALQCKIFRARFEAGVHQHTPGTILSDGRHYLQVAVKDGLIQVLSIQLEGKRRMEIQEFLRGFNPGEGTSWFS